MTKKEIIQLYIADLNNLVANSDAKRSRIIDLEDELEALRMHAVVGQSEQLKAEVFTLANKLAVAGEGDSAVAMHRIHNRL